MIIYKRKFVRIAEYWFDEVIQSQPVDVNRIIRRSTPLAGKGYKEVYTIFVDLKKEKEILFNTMKKETRYEIRRAIEKDGLIYESCSIDNEIITQFVTIYNKFALKKRFSKKKIQLWRFLEYARLGVLDISRVRTMDNGILVWNVFHVDKDHASALCICPHNIEEGDNSYSQLVGRASRFVYWQNMVKFKGWGVSTFDFGGWYAGNTDLAQLGINRFKEGFGSEIVKHYSQEFGISFKGKLFVFLLNVRDVLNTFFRG